MLVSELIDENCMYNGKEIEIKPYISFIEKKILCLNVLENCMSVDENSMVVCDYFLRKLVRDINLIKKYTNIEISDDNYISEYDFLVENKIFDSIINGINNSELDFIDSMIEQEVNQRINVCNSIESIIASKLDKLIDKLPTDKQLKSLSKSLVKDINKMNWDKVPMLRDMWLSANGKSGEKVGN